MLKSFEFHDPGSLTEVLELLEEYKGEAKVIAGGTDLLNDIRDGVISPSHVINIKDLDELKGIEKSEGGIRIGSATLLSEVSKSTLIKDKYNILKQAADVIGSPLIRNVGTIGGNICTASPCMDSAPPLICLDAEVVILSLEGERTIPIGEFFVGVKKTLLRENELLKEIYVPEPPDSVKGIYIKQGRCKEVDLALVGVALLLSVDGVKCDFARIALGSVAPTPIRAIEAEEYLEGTELTGESIEKAAKLAQSACAPITDVRASEEYRKDLIKTLVKRGLTELSNRLWGRV